MPQQELEQQFRQGVRWSLIGSFGATLFQFLQMVVFARLAGPEQAGDYALAAVFMGLLTPLAEAGLSQALVSARALTPRHFVTLSWLNFVVSALIFSALWLLGPWVAAWYQRPALATLLPVMGIALLATPLGAQYGALLARDLRFDAAAKIQVVSGALSFLAVAFLAWKGWGPWAMATGFIVKNVLASLGCWLSARRHFPVKWLKISPLSEIMPYLRFAVFDLSARWADYLANWLDSLIVGKWLGASSLGFYNLAYTIGTLPTARLGYVVTRVTFPLFARTQGDLSLRQTIFQRASRDVALLLFPVYATLALFSTELIQLVYGPAWLPSAPLLCAFGVAGLVRTLAAVFPQLTRGIGKPQLLFTWLLAWTLAANSVLCLVLWCSPDTASAAWSRVAAKILFELPLLAWLAGRCGVAFGPLLHFAGKLLQGLAPVAILVVLADILIPGFGIKLVAKALVWGGGLGWLVWKGALRGEFRALWENFGKGRFSEKI